MMTSGSTRLQAAKRPPFIVRAIRALWRLATDRSYRNVMWALWFRPEAVFQPINYTAPNRYPRIFRFVQSNLGADSEVRILSFGCSTGDEVFSLRQYFPRAAIKGIDINPANIAACKRDARKGRDDAVAFDVASSTGSEPAGTYDAIFCMAVLRHGSLARPGVTCCDHLIRFSDFAATVADFNRCLKPGGFLAIVHSNFRFGDTATSAVFEPVLKRRPSRDTPLFGPDNIRLPAPDGNVDVVFRKRL